MDTQDNRSSGDFGDLRGVHGDSAAGVQRGWAGAPQLDCGAWDTWFGLLSGTLLTITLTF